MDLSFSNAAKRWTQIPPFHVFLVIVSIIFITASIVVAICLYLRILYVNRRNSRTIPTVSQQTPLTITVDEV
uniref:Uncharacterized protein n=1 Tax=Panagrolaimus sp. PS1159 TaxID=55785 RepID=A0AC35FLP7_9BILA